MKDNENYVNFNLNINKEGCINYFYDENSSGVFGFETFFSTFSEL